MFTSDDPNSFYCCFNIWLPYCLWFEELFDCTCYLDKCNIRIRIRIRIYLFCTKLQKRSRGPMRVWTCKCLSKNLIFPLFYNLLIYYWKTSSITRRNHLRGGPQMWILHGARNMLRVHSPLSGAFQNPKYSKNKVLFSSHVSWYF